MLIAETEAGERTHATPADRALCPQCKKVVIAKCGSLNIWHWAHECTAECDSWGEPETDWHFSWKLAFPEDCREIVIGSHRADIRTHNGWVIELQHSAISIGEILEREISYGRMAWVVDAEPFLNNLSLRPKETHLTFRWKWPRLSWAWAKKPLFLDMRDGTLFRVRKIHPHTPCGGWGRIISRDEFLVRAGGDMPGLVTDLDIHQCESCHRNGALLPVYDFSEQCCQAAWECRFCGSMTVGEAR